MTMHEHFDLLEQLQAQYQEKLAAIDPDDEEAIAWLTTEFRLAVIGAGQQFNPKTRVISEGGRTKVVWA